MKFVVFGAGVNGRKISESVGNDKVACLVGGLSKSNDTLRKLLDVSKAKGGDGRIRQN